MNMNPAHIQAFAESDESVQPDIYVTYDAESNITVYFEDDTIQLDLGYMD